MAISFVGVASSTAQDNNDQFVITKPSGVQSGDLLVAAVASYPGESGSVVNIVPPAGWTWLSNVFANATRWRTQLDIMVKVAGASEPGSWVGNYQFGSPDSNQLIESRICVAYRGAAWFYVLNTSAVGQDSSYTVGSVQNPASYFWRVTIGAYVSTTTNYEIDSSELVERRIAGIERSGSSNAIELGFWDSGDGVAIGNHSRTISRGAVWDTSAAFIGILSATDAASSGDFAATLPTPTMTASAAVSHDGTLAATLPKPTMTASAIGTPPEGPLAVPVTPVMTVAAATAVSGTVDTAILPLVDFATETRRFGIRIINIDAESRTVIPLLGTDTVDPSRRLSSLFAQEVAGGDLFRAKLYLPQVDVAAELEPATVLEATLPRPEVLFTGDGGAIYVQDYATPQLAANAATNKQLIFPTNQTYTVTNLLIPAGCSVTGNGSTLKFPNNSTTSSTQSDAILSINGSGVTIDGLKFDGNSQNQGFPGVAWSQFRHCVKAHGNFSNITVKNCEFTNIIGDGVYVNVGASANNATVGPNNTFMANHDNRNGISIISGVDIEVFGNTLTNQSRDDMPGAIDIEPNASDTLSDVFVHDNTVIGGSTQAASPWQPCGIVFGGFQNTPANNINIHNNDVSGLRYKRGILVIGINGGPFNLATNINVYNNNVHDIAGRIPANAIGYELAYWIGANFTGNTFTGGGYAGIGSWHACLGTVSGNTFTGTTVQVQDDFPTCS